MLYDLLRKICSFLKAFGHAKAAFEHALMALGGAEIIGIAHFNALEALGRALGHVFVKVGREGLFLPIKVA